MKILLILAAVAVASVLAVIWFLNGTGDVPDVEEPAAEQIVAAQPAERKESSAERPKAEPSSKAVQPPKDHATADSDADFTPQEQKIVDDIQAALDDDNFKKVAAQIKEAAASKNPAVRMKAVEALQWFGAKALPELILFVADEDDDVRTMAADSWVQGLSQMEPGDDKATAVRLGLTATTDSDQLDMMVMQVDNLTDAQRIDVLSKVIDGSNKFASDVAREHYRFWTNEDYTSAAAAQQWLAAQTAENAE